MARTILRGVAAFKLTFKEVVLVTKENEDVTVQAMRYSNGDTHFNRNFTTRCDLSVKRVSVLIYPNLGKSTEAISVRVAVICSRVLSPMRKVSSTTLETRCLVDTLKISETIQVHQTRLRHKVVVLTGVKVSDGCCKTTAISLQTIDHLSSTLVPLTQTEATEILREHEALQAEVSSGD